MTEIQNNTEINESTILYSIEKKIATIEINRPDKMNALRWNEMELLLKYLKEADENAKVKIIRIKSAGTRAFLAGLDLDMVSKLTPNDLPKLLQYGNELVRYMMKIKKPIVVQIQGAAVGWGCIATLAADFVIVGENPKTFFALPEIDVGIYPATAALTLALAHLGIKKAKSMLLIPLKMSIREFYDYGIISEIVPLEDLDIETFKFCRNLTKKSESILYLTKAVMNNIHYKNFEEQMEKEARATILTKITDLDKYNQFIEDLWSNTPIFDPKSIN